jgi:hypothetical protein
MFSAKTGWIAAGARMIRMLIVASWFAAAGVAWGVIKVDFPVSRMYGDSASVLVARVAEWSPDTKVAVLKIDAVQKGGFAHDKVRLQFAQPEGVAGSVTVGSPVVMFLGETDGKSIAIVHAADKWLLANGIMGVTPPAWRATSLYDAVRGYPGHTRGVVRLVRAMKDGVQVLDDVVDPDGFAGTAREVIALGSPALFLSVRDLNYDGRPDVVAGTDSGVRVFIKGQQEYTESTAASGLAGVKARSCVAGDVDGDGKTDLILDRSVWIGGAGRFAPASLSGLSLGEGPVLAGAVHDVTSDGKADVVLLSPDGAMVVGASPGSSGGGWTVSRTNLWRGDTASAAAFSDHWGEEGELCAVAVRGGGVFRYSVSPGGPCVSDIERLTGATLASCGRLKDRPIRATAAAAWDCDGNRKADFIAFTASGGVMLMNRGLGALLVNDGTLAKLSASLPGGLGQAIAAGCSLAAGPARPQKKWRQVIFVALGDGRVFEVE